MANVRYLIKQEIQTKEFEIGQLKERLDNIPNEFSPKTCNNCKTKNLHYNPMNNNWVCEFC